MGKSDAAEVHELFLKREHASHLIQKLSIIPKDQRVARIFVNHPFEILLKIATAVGISCRKISLVNAEPCCNAQGWANWLNFFIRN